MWFPVYASVVSFGYSTSSTTAPVLAQGNTRHRWLVRPYPVGTSTLQEMPSFLAHNGLGLSGQPIPLILNQVVHKKAWIHGPLQRAAKHPVYIRLSEAIVARFTIVAQASAHRAAMR